MPLQPSLRRRRISSQTARLSQPLPWTAGQQMSLLASVGVVTATSGASANATGAWVQLIPSTTISAGDTTGLLLIAATGPGASATNDNSTLIDIGTGAAGQEVVIVPDVAIGGLQNTALHLAIPVRIPGATRVAFRSRCATASRLQRFTSVFFYALPFVDRLPTTLDVLGTSQSTSAGTAMSGSSGTWVEINASTTKDYQALVIIPSGAANFTGGTTTTNKLELGVGASGSEEVVAAYNTEVSGANGYVVPAFATLLAGACGRYIPAGSRIAVRHDRASNPERLCACVIGVPYV